MRIVTLTTDLGTMDYYVGWVKGELLSSCQNNNLNIIDITHDIPSFNINPAAFVLKNIFLKFPPGTIHAALVNGHKENDTKLIAGLYKDRFFIMPDNGLFYLAFEEYPSEFVELSVTSQFSQKSTMVQGILKLLDDQPLMNLGNSRMKMVEAIFPLPDATPHRIKGSVLYIDKFENIYTNINRQLFDDICGNRPFHLFVHNQSIQKILNVYSDTVKGELACFFSSSGYLVIAINKGKAKSLLGIDYSSKIIIEFSG